MLDLSKTKSVPRLFARTFCQTTSAFLRMKRRYLKLTGRTKTSPKHKNNNNELNQKTQIKNVVRQKKNRI